jgi:hypothetical protein
VNTRSSRSRGPGGPAAAFLAFALVAGGCGGGDNANPASVSPATSPPTSSADPGRPVGVIAIGHSGLTGAGSDRSLPRQAAPENSWATGTSPEVNSIYRRLVAVRPATEGHVANTAEGGASASVLTAQVRRALETVPVPALVVVQTIDNDIRCDGTDQEHVPEFGAALAEALEVVSTASPNSRILVVGQLARPSPSFVEKVVAEDPTMQASLTGTGECDFYGPDGRLVQEHFDTLTSIIEDYEAEQARVCATVPNCGTDDGARAAYVDRLENFSSDWNHLNVRGQAEAAKIAWPVVAAQLEL